MSATPKWIVAHRGNHCATRENSLDAFQRAIDCHVDLIEFDVRRTADEVLIVHHDPTFANLLIAQSEYPALARMSAAPPRLADVLKLAAGRLKLDVELKEPGYEQDVLRQIVDHGYRRTDFVVTSSDAGTVAVLREDATAGLLVENMSWSSAVTLFHGVRAAFLAPHYPMIESEPGIPLLPWTVNDPGAIRRLLAAPDVLGIVTDLPGLALALRAGSL